MSKTLHITLAQINPVVGDLNANMARIRKIWGESPDHTDLIVLPELGLCGYPPEDLILKPSFLDKVENGVRTLVAESAERPAALLLSCPWRIDGMRYNVVHLIQDGRIAGTVAKHHLPNYGVFDEQRVFTPGPLPAPLDFKGHRLGVLLCEDMWHTDAARALAQQGAELLIVVNASPYEVTKHATRMAFAHERVAETGLPLIYVNQCGGQDELVFDGASFIMNEGGNVILQAEEFVEDVHHTTWEKRDGARHWLCTADTVYAPHDPVEATYQAVVTGLRDYVTKNGFNGVLIGLSGGIDSALSAAIAVDALDRDAVHCVMMPSPFTSQDSLDDAADMAKILGVPYDVVPIDGPVAAFNGILAPHMSKDTPGITFENLQARCRGTILMGLSNATGRMVLSTGNKSEMAVGYATLYGDMCGGFNVLKDLYKTQVYALARFRNGHKPDHALGPHGRVIPERIITRAPTAELKMNQTDQDTLPPYDELDDILHGLIEMDMGLDALVARGHDAGTVRRVGHMLDRAEYKRRQAPPGVKITARAFGRDRRYPITNGFRG